MGVEEHEYRYLIAVKGAEVQLNYTEIAPPGFEPGSPGPEPGVLGRYTTGLHDPLKYQILSFTP